MKGKISDVSIPIVVESSGESLIHRSGVPRFMSAPLGVRRGPSTVLK